MLTNWEYKISISQVFTTVLLGDHNEHSLEHQETEPWNNKEKISTRMAKLGGNTGLEKWIRPSLTQEWAPLKWQIKEMVHSKESSLTKILATRNEPLYSILDGKDFSEQNHWRQPFLWDMLDIFTVDLLDTNMIIPTTTYMKILEFVSILLWWILFYLDLSRDVFLFYVKL